MFKRKIYSSYCVCSGEQGSSPGPLLALLFLHLELAPNMCGQRLVPFCSCSLQVNKPGIAAMIHEIGMFPCLHAKVHQASHMQPRGPKKEVSPALPHPPHNDGEAEYADWQTRPCLCHILSARPWFTCKASSSCSGLHQRPSSLYKEPGVLSSVPAICSRLRLGLYSAAEAKSSGLARPEHTRKCRSARFCDPARANQQGFVSASCWSGAAEERHHKHKYRVASSNVA